MSIEQGIIQDLGSLHKEGVRKWFKKLVQKERLAQRAGLKNVWRIYVRLFFFLLIYPSINDSHLLMAAQNIQNSAVQSSEKKIPLRQALLILGNAYHINIVYDESLVKGKTVSSVPVFSNDLATDLEMILSEHFLSFENVGTKTIVIIPQKHKNYGTLTGKITDQYGDGIPFVQVVVEGTHLGAITNFVGEYVIKNLLPATYSLRVILIGYRQQTATITINPNDTTRQNFKLTQDVIRMDEVVITATRNPLMRRESSVAITTRNSEQIVDIAPRNTADLLRVVPGFYVESSGGEVGGNLFARGLPADGSYYYVALMENGMPVYDAPALSFFNADIFIRVDENIDRIEAVRGGNSALYGSNAPGGVINFISKSGSNRRITTLKTTLGTSGLIRYDLNTNGPLGNNWRFNLGGFYRTDDGIRNPGFRASKGGQLKGNLTYLFSNGYVKFYGKYLNDRNIFYLPLPFKAGSDLEFVDGFPLNGTMTTSEANRVTVPTPNGENFTIPLDDGQKQRGGMGMVELSFTLPGDWSIQNTTRYMNFVDTWNALVPNNLVNADEYAQNFVNNTPGAAGYDIFYTNHFNSDGNHTRFNTGKRLLCESGLWHVYKPLENISNQFHVQKNFLIRGVGHHLTVGTYYGHYKATDWWYWQEILTDVRNAPRLIDVRLKNKNGDVIRESTENGFRRYGSMYMNANGSVKMMSFFVSDDVNINDKLHVDVGFRLERNYLHQVTEDSTTYDLGNFTDADDAVVWGNGTFLHANATYTDWATSVGINYTFNHNLSIYARGSRGYKMPTLDVFRYTDGSFKPDAENLIQGETGFKLGTSTFGANVTAYFVRLSNFPSQDARVVGGRTVWVIDYVGTSQTIGMEIEAISKPVKDFTLSTILTFQDHKYIQFIKDNQNYKGNWVQRIPRFIGEITVSYSIHRLKLRADYQRVGNRFANNANTIELPGFGNVNFSMSFNLKQSKTQKLTFGLYLLNAFNGIGLTEGNPRLDNSDPSKGDYYLARPILPRRLKAVLGYDF